jgi:hypothetical protein
MSSVDDQVVPLATTDGRLRVEFRWSHDRFVHRVLLDQVEVARSIDGDSSELWPASPPMQQLSLEPIQGSDAILGVGAAGRSHWSLSVELEQGENESQSFRFEWAARCRDLPTSLGSAYSVANSIAIIPCEGPEGVGPVFRESSEADGWRELSIGPETAAPAGSGSSAATTFRWSYRIACRN